MDTLIMGRQSFELILSANDKNQHIPLDQIEDKDILFSELLSFAIENKLDLKDIQMRISGNDETSFDSTIQEFNQLKAELVEQFPQAFLNAIKEIPTDTNVYQSLLELKTEKDISYNRFADEYSSSPNLKELFYAQPDTKLLFKTLAILPDKPTEQVLQAIFAQSNLELFKENLERLSTLTGDNINQKNALFLPSQFISLTRINPEDVKIVLDHFKFNDLMECKKNIRNFVNLDEQIRKTITQNLQHQDIVKLLDNLNIKTLDVMTLWAKQEQPIDIEKMKSLLENLNEQSLSLEENKKIFRSFVNGGISKISKDYDTFLDYISKPEIANIPYLSYKLSADILQIKEEDFFKNLIKIHPTIISNLIKSTEYSNIKKQPIDEWDAFKTWIRTISEDKIQYMDILDKMGILNLETLQKLKDFDTNNIEMMNVLPLSAKDKEMLLIAYMNNPIPQYLTYFLEVNDSPDVLSQLTTPPKS